MAPRRVAFLLGLAAALTVGTALRLSTREQLRQGERVRALTSDDAYHLRRARFAVAHFPRTIFFDPLMNFPEGGVGIWPPLFDLALAAPARLLHGPRAPAGAVEREAAWIPVLFAAGAIVLAGLLGRLVAGELAGAGAALFVAVCPGHILWSQYGHTDQHAGESFFGLLVLLLFLRSREEPAGSSSLTPALSQRERAQTWREAAAGIALALSVLAWQGAIYWGAIVALSLVLEAVRTRRPILSSAGWTLGMPALLVAGATAAWLGPVEAPFTYVSFGFFQPLFLGALAGGAVLLETFVRAARRELPRRELAARALFLLLAVAFTLPFAPELASGFARGVGYVLGVTREEVGAAGYISYPKDWLKGIFEARPLLADGPALPARQLSAAFFLAPLVLLLWIARAARGLRPALHITLSVWGAVTLFLAIAQRLNVHYAAPLAAICLVEAAAACGRAAERQASKPAGAVAATAAAVLLALPMAPGLREETGAIRAPGSDLFGTLDWMRRALPLEVDPYDPRLLDPERSREATAGVSSVLAPWSLGHLLLYYAERPVVANNFGYGFLDSIRFFLSESEEEALVLAARHRARWVVATDLVPRMNDYASYLGRAPYLRVTPQGLSPTPGYFATLQARLYDFDGKGGEVAGLTVRPLERLRLLHRSRSAIRRGGRWIARWKVFEILPAEGSLQGRGP